jgi:phosphatidylglycerol---prolipoprotein diacylglyceryl transferase
MCSSDRLGAVVARAHRVGPRFHPYFLCFDLAMIAGLGVGIAYAAFAGGITVAGWVAVFAIEACLYHAYVAFKRRVLGIASRSFLQDTLFFLLPTYVLVSLAVGHSLTAALDVLGLMFPIVLSLVRVGCFLGGCCYGRPSPHGVRYPASIFRPFRTWRTFTPGPLPHAPVLPVQLYEAAVNLALFAGLALRLALGASASSATLWLYFLGYAPWRLVAESLRGTRHRPKWGRFSQAQWLSAALVPVAAVLLALMA